MPGSEGGIRATDLSLSILEYISERKRVTLSEVAKEFEIATSTAHNHLKTLTTNRLLEKSGREYQLGIRLFHFGQRARGTDLTYNVTHKTVQNLAQTTNQEADFLVEDGGRMLSIFDVAKGTPDPDFTVGEFYHMHTSATGKATLATYSDEEINKIVDKWGLPEQTEHTISDRESLFKELEEVQNQGYAINNQEIVEGLYSIGMVVREPDGSNFGGISVGGPTYRLNQESIDEIVDPLQNTVDQLEDQIRKIRSSQ